jgi:hypothetical protein
MFLAWLVQALRADMIRRHKQVVDAVLRHSKLAGAHQQPEGQREASACHRHEIASMGILL